MTESGQRKRFPDILGHRQNDIKLNVKEADYDSVRKSLMEVKFEM
jgi:hypothetical protein